MKIPTFLSRHALVYAVMATALLGINAAQADSVASYSAVANSSFSVVYPKGQSFTTLASTAKNNISFNFLTYGSGAPFAAGTGFLYSQAYTGTVAQLGSSNPTFLGSAAASNGYYNFGSSLSLSPSTQYFFYENAFLSGSGANLAYGGVYAGGSAYTANSSDATFGSITESFSFQVNGSPVTNSVPDTGSTLALLGLGLGSLALARHKLRMA